TALRFARPRLLEAWNARGDACSFTRERRNFEATADRLRTLAHGTEAATWSRGGRIEPGTVVRHRQYAFARRLIEGEFDVRRARMFGNVVERFQRDTKQRDLDLVPRPLRWLL